MPSNGSTNQRSKAVTLPKRFVVQFWKDADQQSPVVKTIRRRYQKLKEHCGGEESYQRDLLCQRLAFISILLESMEVTAVAGSDAFDLGVYVQASNNLTGLLKTLGLERRVKRVGDLATYLEDRKAVGR